LNVENPRFPLFDSLRAIAALAIVAFHCFVFTGDQELSAWARQLSAGVPLFFLISGFLLYRPFARARLAGAGTPSVRNYAVRRALRIFPAYWIVLAFTALWFGIHSGEFLVKYAALVHVYDAEALSALPALRPSWTLGVELSFYCLLPLLALALRRVPFGSVRGFVVTEGAALAGLAVAAVAWNRDLVPERANTIHDTASFVIVGHLDHFAIGMALAVASVVLVDARDSSRISLPALAPAVTWGVAALALAAAAQTGFDTPRRELATHTLHGLAAAGILLPAAFEHARAGLPVRILSARPLLWLGTVSYGIYLWHFPVMAWLNDVGLHSRGRPVPFIPIAVGLTLLLAAASYYLVERHALALGRRISGRTTEERGPSLAGYDRARAPSRMAGSRSPW
jgi:peptidoglycan/LPS O-acetylase OafA/YrhL